MKSWNLSWNLEILPEIRKFLAKSQDFESRSYGIFSVINPSVDGHAGALRFYYSINKIVSSVPEQLLVKWKYWTSNCLRLPLLPSIIFHTAQFYSCAMQDQHNQLTVVTRALITLTRGLNCFEFWTWTALNISSSISIRAGRLWLPDWTRGIDWWTDTTQLHAK